MTTAQRIIKYLAIALAMFLIVGIVVGILQGIAAILSLDGSSSIEDELFELTVETDGKSVEALCIELSASDLTVKRGDTLRVETNNTDVTCTQRDGVLSLREKARGGRIFGISFGNVKSGTVILTLPDAVFEEITLENGAGKVTADVLSAKRAEFDFGAGNVEIECLTVTESIEINGGVGNFTVKDGILRDLKLDMGVSDVEIRALLLGECDLNLDVGNAKITILGDAKDYRVILDKGIGKAQVNGQTVKGGSAYGDGENLVDIDGGIGSIEVTFVMGTEG